MSSTLPTIHLLAGIAAEINEAQAQLHRAEETLAGIKAQLLYAISEASRPVDPEPQVEEGAAAPGKPPRPTEGGVAVTEAGSEPLVEEGGSGLAELGAGARAFSGGAVISSEADQALDGASLGEEAGAFGDPGFAPGGEDFQDVTFRYSLYGGNVRGLSRHFGIDQETIVFIIRTARGMGNRHVAHGDFLRLSRGLPLE